MSDNVPAGWYPTPDGKQKYWDGERWTNLPLEGIEATEGPSRAPKSRVRLIVVSLLVALGLLAGAGGALWWKSSIDAQIAAEEAQAAAEARADAQDKKDDAERATRLAMVVQIEASVKTMAEKHIGTGLIDGPVVDVNCSPLGGGSTDDLSEQTTVFECFVANKDNGDGTMSGYYYNATMNWTTGSYTYGFGRG